MATHSSVLAGKIQWTEEPDCGPWGHKESDTTEANEQTGMISLKKVILPQKDNMGISHVRTHLNVTFIQVNKAGANSLLKYALTRQPWLPEMLESNN